MTKIKAIIKKLVIFSVIIFFAMTAIGVALSLSGYEPSNKSNNTEKETTNHNNDNSQRESEITEKEVYQELINCKISFEYGDIKISELLDSTLGVYNSIGGNAYMYDGYAYHVHGNVWKAGVYINADGDKTWYGWEYNIKTNKETPLSWNAKKLYP